MKKCRGIYFRLSKDEHDKIKIEAIKRGITMTVLLKQAIVEYFLKYIR